ncbi:MAG: PH domain-containing protein [Ignavibacteria bacterium]|nr:PH domain-containing protein [Ignavibacteria bacterium]
MKTQLKKDEKVILITKPHWFILILPVLITLIVSAVCIYFGGYVLIALILPAGYLTYKIIERNCNIWIVTSLRVIDEEGVFTHNTKESPLDKINNVSYSMTFWGKIFRYGNVQIQTAAEIGSTVYYDVSNPKKLKDTITHMQEEYKHQQIKKQATELAGAIAAGQQKNKFDVAAELEKLYDLKVRGILTEEEFNSRKTKILNS